MGYRVIEELCEAQEANDHGNEDHEAEEEIDALHFLVELCIVVGIPPLGGGPTLPGMNPEFKHIVKHIGLAGNCLKMKPWKQTPHITDQTRYKACIITAAQSLRTRLESKFNLDEIYLLYFRKNQVNQFRQRSNY